MSFPCCTWVCRTHALSVDRILCNLGITIPAEVSEAVQLTLQACFFASTRMIFGQERQTVLVRTGQSHTGSSNHTTTKLNEKSPYQARNPSLGAPLKVHILKGNLSARTLSYSSVGATNWAFKVL